MPRRSRRAAQAGAVVLGLFLSQPSGAAQSAEPTAAELFNVYRQGQFEAFAAQLARVRDFGALRKQIAREGPDWPLEAKAAFLLETADAALQHKALTIRTGPEVELFEDACKAARQLPPQGQFEAAWQAMALSVLSARYAAVIPVDDHLKPCVIASRFAIAADTRSAREHASTRAPSTAAQEHTSTRAPEHPST